MLNRPLLCAQVTIGPYTVDFAKPLSAQESADLATLRAAPSHQDSEQSAETPDFFSA